MSESTNPRKKASTKLKIIDSYIRLLETKKFDKVTVRELCDESEIVRSTFYTHYQSVYDLIEEIESDLLEDLVYYRKGDERTPNPHEYRYSDEEKYHEYFAIPLESTVRFFENIDRYREYLQALLGENGDPYFEIRLKKQLEKDVNLMMDAEGIPNDFLRPYFCESIVALQLNLLKYWIRADERVSIDYICKISNIVRAGATYIDFKDLDEFNRNRLNH